MIIAIISQVDAVGGCSAVDSLVAAGVLESRPVDGGLEIAIPMKHLTYKPLVLLSDPYLEMSVTDRSAISKLDLITLLHREGFEGVREPPVAWTPAARMVYRLQSVLSGSKSYLLCLVRREEILSKGVCSILHNRDAKYYRLLLGLADLREVQQLLDRAALTPAKCKSLLEDSGVPVEEPEEPLQMLDAPNQEAGVLHESAPVQIALHAAEQARMRPHVFPPIPIAGTTVPIVYFDGCSHKNGILRGFTKCIWGHEGCHKYQQSNVAGSRERLISFLYAWNLWGEGKTREDHAGNSPPDDIVQAQHDLLFPG